MLAFVMLWAYFSFSQYLIIYSGNLPEEITWYTHRLFRPAGGSSASRWSCSISRVPFLLLLSRPLKRSPQMLVKVAIGIIVVRLIDLFWLIAPGVPPRAASSVSWMDVVLPLSLGGDLARLLHRGSCAAGRFCRSTIRSSRGARPDRSRRRQERAA